VLAIRSPERSQDFSESRVASGQTVLLGGLIMECQERDKSGLPLLDKLGR